MSASGPHRWRGTLARLCLGLSALLSSLVLLSWPLGLWRWLTFGEGYIPMAPSTALALLVLASGARFQREAAGRSDGLTRVLTMVAGLVGLGIALLAWAPPLLGTSTPLTRFRARPVPGDAPVPCRSGCRGPGARVERPDAALGSPGS